MSAATTSIFVSHCNHDNDANEVVDELVNKLKEHLHPTHDGYGVVSDNNNIPAGVYWRDTIEYWLYDCPAAIILLSKNVFNPNYPWVAFEANFLSTRKLREKNLCVIPVRLDVSDELLASSRVLDPGRLREINGLRYPHPSGPNDIPALVNKIAERLKEELSPFDARPFTGLAKALCDKLIEFPTQARLAAMKVFDGACNETDEKMLTQKFLDDFTNPFDPTDPGFLARKAFRELCAKSPDKNLLESKKAIIQIVAALRVDEEPVKPIALESMKPKEAGCALLLDEGNKNIVDLYITRAIQRSPHDWKLLKDTEVMEFSDRVDLKNRVRKFVANTLRGASGTDANDQFRDAKASIKYERKDGKPVVLCADYPSERDPDDIYKTIMEICPDLLVIYTPSQDTGAAHESKFIRKVAPLGWEQDENWEKRRGDLVGPFNALMKDCVQSPPQKDKNDV